MCELRQQKMQEWLATLTSYSFDLSTVSAASSDASFRRYFRVAETGTGKTHVVMDAPPDKEDVKPFLHVAHALKVAGLNAPDILASNLQDGFLLLTDFGNTTFLQALGQGASSESMYRRAMSDLVHMQTRTSVAGLPLYAAEKLLSEMALFEQWFIQAHHRAELTTQEKNWLAGIQNLLVQSALAESQVFVHRDYHSRNLMLLPGTEQTPELGIIDFQDAVAGPLSYDLVSLLRDAYIQWPEEQTLDWTIRYWEEARKAGLKVPADIGEFYRQFDFMGLQRHLKVLGIFARLNHRDGKAQYLNDLPLVLEYVRKVAARYIAFKPLLLILDRLEDKAVQVAYSF
ncbi:MAG TPA: phosphotransferase [Limnobacter sp.]|uniref:aminoglycoside phosphotransferase family protein n=1 Tax=Limnobacter sp. TaxID=2003368 RepID=UPI002E2FA63D|nr:phosphotransferase [Limnobacter sp.]HEX5486618.1 phosphotransferase [Limnobacter sp.]